MSVTIFLVMHLLPESGLDFIDLRFFSSAVKKLAYLEFQCSADLLNFRERRKNGRLVT